MKTELLSMDRRADFFPFGPRPNASDIQQTMNILRYLVITPSAKDVFQCMDGLSSEGPPQTAFLLFLSQEEVVFFRNCLKSLQHERYGAQASFDFSRGIRLCVQYVFLGQRRNGKKRMGSRVLGYLLCRFEMGR